MLVNGENIENKWKKYFSALLNEVFLGEKQRNVKWNKGFSE